MPFPVFKRFVAGGFIKSTARHIASRVMNVNHSGLSGTRQPLTIIYNWYLPRLSNTWRQLSMKYKICLKPWHTYLS